MVEKKKIIDKNFKPTIFAFITLFILAIAYFLTLPPATYNSQTSKDNFLFDFPTDKVNYIKFEDRRNPSINCELILKNNVNWFINGYEAYQQSVINILGFLKTVKIQDKITDYSNLNQFGLNPPEKKLFVGFNDPNIKTISIDIGSYTPARTSRYVKFPLKNEVFIVDNSVYDSLTVTPQTLWDRDMFKFPPEKIVSFSIKNKNKLIEVFLQDNKWLVNIDNSLKFPADEDKIALIANNFFGNAANAVYKRNINDTSKLYMNPPLFNIKAKDTKGKIASVDISQLIPGTKLHYAYNKSSKTIFLLDDEKVKTLIFDDLEIKNKNLIIPQMTSIKTIKIKLKDNKNALITKTSINSWQCSANLNKEDSQCTKYAKKLLSMQYDYVTLINPNSKKDVKDFMSQIALDKPELELQVIEKDTNYPYFVKIGKKAKDSLHYSLNSSEIYLNCMSNEKYKELISIFNN